MVPLSHPCLVTGKTIALTIWTFVSKVIFLLYKNVDWKVGHSFSSKEPASLIPWLQSPSAVILEPPRIKFVTLSIVYICLPWMDGVDAMILVLWMLSFKPAFSFSSFTFIKRFFTFSTLSSIEWCHLLIWGYWYFPHQSDSSLCFIQPSVSHDVLCM